MRLTFIYLFLFTNLLSAQIDSAYLYHDLYRINDQKNGIKVLGTWSGLNIISGFVLRNNSQGENKYFYEMNAYWNIINSGISFLGYFNNLKEKPSTFPMDVLGKQIKLEKNLLFNSALDLTYIAAGAWVLERAKSQITQNDFNKLRGYGRSIIFQGFYLFIFDLSFYLIETIHSKKLKETMSIFFIRKGQLGMNINF
jgi:hypothetical protein